MTVEIFPRRAAALPITWDVLASRRRFLVLWSVAVAAVAAMYTGLYPSMGEGADLESYVENLPDALVEAMGYDTIATAAGYLSSTVFGLLGPVLLAVFAIGIGARLIGGQEEDGTLELELTAPVRRRSLLLQRLLALVLAVTGLTAILVAVTAIFVLALGMDVDFGNLLAAGVGLALFAVTAGTLALAAGAVTGRRAAALGVAAAVVVLGFVLNALAPLLDADWLAAVSPWSWYAGDRPAMNGWDLSGLALMALTTALAAGVGVLAFERRDLGT